VVDEHHEGYELPAARSVQAQHHDPAVPVALVAQRRVAFYGQAPRWPASMIGPSESESARWFELWTHPRAAVWAEAKQEHAVAALVRVEQRCGRTVSSSLAQSEMGRLRGQLGLNDS
jgi:hypothetical protein